MRTKLAYRASEAAGLAALWDTIDDLGTASPAQVALLERAPLAVVGALADHARELWCGERVRILPPSMAAREPASSLALRRGDTGLALLRETAITRLTTDPARHVRLDLATTGMELVQAALLFGADEVCGAIATRAGLPLADRAARALRRADVAGLIKRAGRLPVFVSESGGEAVIDAPDALPPAHRAAQMLAIAGDDLEGGAP
ncbi:MAG: hypothetical protein WCJ30_05790 [Deltaproteobacteria bacterium]